MLKLNVPIIWDDVWNSVHNFLLSNETKTAIWQQLHLNYYTQYSYNKWHSAQALCPLCHKWPDDIYHIILDCNFTNTLWQEIEPILLELHGDPVTLEEKGLGVNKKNPTTGILIRNWLTYSLREQIMKEERNAYKSQIIPNIDTFKRKFNHHFHAQIQIKHLRYQNENNLQVFDKLITYADVLGSKIDENDYLITQIFNLSNE